jgi:hypothetical protein
MGGGEEARHPGGVDTEEIVHVTGIAADGATQVGVVQAPAPGLKRAAAVGAVVAAGHVGAEDEEVAVVGMEGHGGDPAPTTDSHGGG